MRRARNIVKLSVIRGHRRAAAGGLEVGHFGAQSLNRLFKAVASVNKSGNVLAEPMAFAINLGVNVRAAGAAFQPSSVHHCQRRAVVA